MDQSDVQRPPEPGLGVVIKQRREELGWSQAQLAKNAGTTQQTVNRLETGATTHSRAITPIIAALEMGRPLRSVHTAELGLDFNTAAAQPPHRGESSDLWIPVYESFFQGSLATEDPVSYINTPDPLLTVRGAYAMIVGSSDMAPAFRRGDTILVNPHIPARVDNDVLLIGAAGASTMLRTLVGFTDDQWTVKRWDPATEETVSATSWPICHVVVGKFSRV